MRTITRWLPMTSHGSHESDAASEPDIDQTPDDANLEERVRAFLSRQGSFALQGIQIAANGGHVTLRGYVHSFYEKQLCLECTKRVAGVKAIVNRIEVSTVSEGDVPLDQGAK